MKISYELTKKEYCHLYNIAVGALKRKNFLKKIPTQRIFTYFQKSFQKYAIGFITFFIALFFQDFIELEKISLIIFLISFWILLENTISIIKWTIHFHQNKKLGTKGTFRFNKDGIIEIREETIVMSRAWNEIDYILSTEEIILIFMKKKSFFLIPNSPKNKEKLIEYLQKNSLNIKWIEKITLKKLRKFMFYYAPYFIAFFISVIGYIFWTYYNFCQLDKEVWKINKNDYQVDENIYSFGKYSEVEKVLKEYYNDFRTQKEIFMENSALTIYSSITIEVLKNPEELLNIQKSVEEKSKKSTEAIQNILNLLNEEITMSKIKSKNLNSYYEKIFHKYALTNNDKYYLESWVKELENNQEKIKYVKRILEILITEPDCWYIEEEKLYMCDKNREEYNNLYQKIQKDYSNKL